MVLRALEAAEALVENGIEAEVVDPRTLKPFDDATVTTSVIKTGKVLIVHEACKTGGVGAEIAARIMESESFDHLDAPIRRLAGLDIPVPYNRNLERHRVPQVEDIVTAVKDLVA
jgi:pyruvate dehydrogenase E1 component beta subunit